MTNRNGSKGSGNQGSPKSASLIRNLALNLKLVMIIKGKNIVLKGSKSKRSEIIHSFLIYDAAD